MVEISHSVDIRRPVLDVFPYVADPRNFRHRGTGVLQVQQIAGSPAGVGATDSYVRRVFGRTVTGRMPAGAGLRGTSALVGPPRLAPGLDDLGGNADGPRLSHEGAGLP